jgi:hypothetical protein
VAAETDSTGEATRGMKMCNMKDLTLIQSMKTQANLVRGARKGGGAQVTESGRQAFALYKKM